MVSEINIIQQAQAGDKAAFEQLYNSHHQAIFTYIYYRVGEQRLAEDLTGDVFVKMVSKIDTYVSDERPFIAWLYTIAGNLVRDHIRRQQRITWLPLQDQEKDHKESLVNTVDQQLTQEEILTALEQLTDAQREVIILRFLKGETTPIVAKTIGNTVTGVKALQRRALSALKKQLQQRGVYV
jgi:RNA polymerase sigma-70 factor (ECF subfamily)